MRDATAVIKHLQDVLDHNWSGAGLEIRALLDRIASLEAALAIAEREITARTRHGLAETGMSAEQISALVDANPAIVAIRRAASLSSSKQKEGE